MSDKDFLHDNYEWDKEEEVVESGSNTRFAKARLYIFSVNRFLKGEHFTLPGVYHDDYDETTGISTRMGLKEFKAMAISDTKTKWKFYPLVLERTNAQDQSWQRVVQFCNWKDKDDTGCAWIEFQKDEFLSLTDSDKDKLTSAAKESLKNPEESWAYIRYTEGETGYEGQYEIKKYLTDIVVYQDKAQWEKDNTEFFSQFSNGTATDADNSIYPDSWKADIQAMVDYVEQLNREGKSYSEIVESAMITSPAINGKVVNPVEVLATILDIPEPMIEL